MSHVDDHKWMEWYTMASCFHYACWQATFSSCFSWLDMSVQLAGIAPPSPKTIQWDGGLGKNSGRGGSLNLAPAYAAPWGEGDRDSLVSMGWGENLTILLPSELLTGLILSSKSFGEGVPLLLELEQLLLFLCRLRGLIASLCFMFPDQVISFSVKLLLNESFYPFQATFSA